MTKWCSDQVFQVRIQNPIICYGFNNLRGWLHLFSLGDGIALGDVVAAGDGDAERVVLTISAGYLEDSIAQYDPGEKSADSCATSTETMIAVAAPAFAIP